MGEDVESQGPPPVKEGIIGVKRFPQDLKPPESNRNIVDPFLQQAEGKPLTGDLLATLDARLEGGEVAKQRVAIAEAKEQSATKRTEAAEKRARQAEERARRAEAEAQRLRQQAARRQGSSAEQAVDDPKGYYVALGINPNSLRGLTEEQAQDVIKGSFRRRSRILHTDVGGDKNEMQRLNEAHDFLKNPNKRNSYR